MIRRLLCFLHLHDWHVIQVGHTYLTRQCRRPGCTHAETRVK